MNIIINACKKLRETKKEANFSTDHEKVLLCILKHKKLNIGRVTLLLGIKAKKVKKVLDDLTKKGILIKKGENYCSICPFESLYALIN